MVKSKTVVSKQETKTLTNTAAVNGWDHNDESVKSWNHKQSPFEHLYVDITHKCNMKCNVCYNPIRTIPDLSVDWFNDVVKNLPHPTELVILGGEPTIHKDFFEFIEVAYKHGHSVYIPTNGKKIARDKSFCKELARLNKVGRMKIYTDMSGGIAEPGFGGENGYYYEKIHGEQSYEEKIQMIENLKEMKFKRLTISAIIIRGLNEVVMPDMFELAKRYETTIREIAYKSQGKIGRYHGDAAPYLTNDWILLMLKQKLATPKTLSNVVMSGFVDERCGGKNCCYYYMHNRRLMISWLDFLCNTCWKRGQLIEGPDSDDARVEYMFESLQANDFNKLFPVIKKVEAE